MFKGDNGTANTFLLGVLTQDALFECGHLELTQDDFTYAMYKFDIGFVLDLK